MGVSIEKNIAECCGPALDHWCLCLTDLWRCWNSFLKHRNFKSEGVLWNQRRRFGFISLDSGPVKDSLTESPSLWVETYMVHLKMLPSLWNILSWQLKKQYYCTEICSSFMCICRNSLWDLSVWDTDKWMYFQFWKIFTFCLSLSYYLKNAFRMVFCKPPNPSNNLRMMITYVK